MYIDFISGNTTVTVGADHIQNTDINAANLVGVGYIRPDGINNQRGSYPSHNSPYGNVGVGITQAFPGFGNLSYYYAPNASSINANDIANDFASTQVEAGNNSMSELVFIGDLGVKGLRLIAGQQFHSKDDLATAKDKDGKHISAAYNMGAFTVAAEKKIVEGTNTGSGGSISALGNEKVTGKSAGIAYAVTKELSVGYTQAEAKTDANSIDEEVKLYAIGYNLGPVALSAQLMKVDNAANRAVNDGDIVRVRLSTAF
jgi:hypothetical protein